MAGQPANSSIQIYRRVRAQREPVRHDSIASITKRLRPLTLVVPGREDKVEYANRKTTVTDFSPFMGQAAVGATRGFPLTVRVRDSKSFAQGAEGITGVGMPVKIGGDVFLEQVPSALGRDLFADARAV